MKIDIRPQPGPQEQFLATSADIAFYGGAAGSGKTFALLLEPLRHINTKSFGAVIFRRTTKQVRKKGGLWDTSAELYTYLGGDPSETNLKWRFEDASIEFDHLEYDKDVFSYQGAQIPLIGFDEATHFTENQFWYLLSRNRSTCGVRPYIRATCNPQAKGWVRNLVDWWIDKDGNPITSRSGKIRWFIRVDDKLVWGDSRKELERYKNTIPKSFTFVPAKLSDNKILEEKDPGYRANLMALPKIQREELLGGNWNVVARKGMYFRREWFEEKSAHPQLESVVRCWDRAATEWEEGDPGDPDYTVGLKLGKDINGMFWVLDIARMRHSAYKVEQIIKNVASQDGTGVTVKGFQDPGGAGKGEIENFVKMLAGHDVVYEKITVNKETAARPASAQSEAGNIKILSTCRNKDHFYEELSNFPEGAHDDMVDALSGAFNHLTQSSIAKWDDSMVQLNEPKLMEW